jgi:membrane-bound serine protease (ClpP class)
VFCIFPSLQAADREVNEVASPKLVYILPVRENIMPPLTYLVRRGVKEAMEAKADLLLIDMETDGGRVDVTQEIIEIINQFPGETVTYVNRNAFSAGAFIAVATQKIFMAPESVIGAAAPIMVGPGGAPGQEMPDTMEAKMTSAIKALIRTQAEKNGHNIAVVEAMIDKNKRLEIDGEVLSDEGDILTLTNLQAEKEYGQPPIPLLSSGTIESIDELLAKLGYAEAEVVRIEPTGAEKLATWINTLSPLLLLLGIVGLYLEFKTPGFGIPGILGLVAIAIYFFGGYVAGLSGLEWVAIFLLGLILVVLELFVFPGTLFLGLAGTVLMLISLVMAMVDMYPGGPPLPDVTKLVGPVMDLAIGGIGAVLVIILLGSLLPKTSIYDSLVSHSASGMTSVLEQKQKHSTRIGQIGVALSSLHPGGKAQFEDQIIDVISHGEMIEAGTQVRIIGHSSTEAVVESVA